MRNKTIIYVLLVTLYIIAGTFKVEAIHYFTKPLLMPVLIWMIWPEIKNTKLRNTLSLALLFSLFGDVFLLFDLPNFFLFGLGSFLVTQLLYIFLFRRTAKLKPIHALPYLFFVGLMCFAVLSDNLSPDLTIPIYVYMGVIMCMGVFSAARKVSTKSFELVLIGASLFILSDSFIAIDQFVNKVPYRTFWVMASYAAAQYFIAKGLILEDRAVN